MKVFNQFNSLIEKFLFRYLNFMTEEIVITVVLQKVYLDSLKEKNLIPVCHGKSPTFADVPPTILFRVCFPHGQVLTSD